mgnify:CR=1 FL=1
MFSTVFVEQDIYQTQRVQSILAKIKYKNIKTLSRYDDVWGKVKKPYLQKRENLNLFIANKRGNLIKETPDAYGTGRGKHFYFIHSYNCIYECEYCYLQGYFNTPDIVFFVNHEDIVKQMGELIQKYPNEELWFHAGEFSDSLNLSHITQEYKIYYDFFKNNPNCFLELRSKSVNIKEVIELPPLDNIIISFSLASDSSAKEFDRKCPSIKHRLNAIEKLAYKNYKLGLHFDPIIYHEGFLEEYETIFEQLSHLPLETIQYISIGVVRFTKDVYHQVANNYPDSNIHKLDFTKSFDNKLRYNRPMRMWVLNRIKNSLLLKGFQDEKIYLCME